MDTGYAARGLSLNHNRIRQVAQEHGAHNIAAPEGDALDFDSELKVEVLSPPRSMHKTSTDPAKIAGHGLLNTNSPLHRMPHDKNVIFFPRDACGTGQRYVLEKTSAIRQGVIHRACPFDIAPTFHDRSSTRDESDVLFVFLFIGREWVKIR